MRPAAAAANVRVRVHAEEQVRRAPRQEAVDVGQLQDAGAALVVPALQSPPPFRFPPSPPCPPGVPVTCAFGQAQTRMEEMSQYFSGEMALTRVTKDEQLQVWSSNEPARARHAMRRTRGVRCNARAWRAMRRTRGVRCNARVACDATHAWRAMQRTRGLRCNARVSDDNAVTSAPVRRRATHTWQTTCNEPLCCRARGRLGCTGLGGACAGLGWSGLGWSGLGWSGLGWSGLGWTAGVVCEHRVGSERSRVRRSFRCACRSLRIGSWHSLNIAPFLQSFREPERA
jgi:hypothetical protein